MEFEELVLMRLKIMAGKLFRTLGFDASVSLLEYPCPWNISDADRMGVCLDFKTLAFNFLNL